MAHFLHNTLAGISQSGETLSFYSLNDGSLIHRHTDLIAEPHELAYDAKRQSLYISHTYRHGHFWLHGDYSTEISVFSLTQREIVDVIDVGPLKGPHGLRLVAEQDMLFASVESGLELHGADSGGVIGIDLAARSVVTQVANGSKSHWFAVTSDARKAYTVNEVDPFLSVLDLGTSRMMKKIAVLGSEEAHISIDGRFVFVPTPSMQVQSGGPPEEMGFIVIDTATDEIVKTVRTTHGVLSIHSTARDQIMVVQYQFEADSDAGNLKPKNGQLALYDATSFELLGEVAIGKGPLELRSSVDGSVGFVANILEGTVSVVDLDAMSVTMTVEVDVTRNASKRFHQGAHGMAAIPGRDIHIQRVN
ncbi:hypothetical protein LTS18_011688 [Coniosporium uncinatum]|uniref:Uncharacterized protein n=1 Tax=Coniosporium uncinatum TaxID=93489 RepID=A0ACC3CYB1_9PEZI|nr:hypothetical protein LTS18_011688 [Coniosporium uncinatum]